MDKKLLKELEKNNCISLKSFLISYCGICYSSLLNENISHEDIKYLLPDLKRSSYEYILKNVKDVYTGKIILVKDSYGHIIPYLKPEIKEYYENNEIEKDDVKEETFEKAINLEKLSLYELSELGKKYKDKNRVTEYRKICRIIKREHKQSGVQEYHKKKEKIKMKGFDDNDKY